MAHPRLARKPNVLAVDDNQANLFALEATLDQCNVSCVHSGQEAIDLLARAPSTIDLVLMDVSMPGMDGFEAARRIKAMPACEDIPIVFITAVFNEDPYVKKGYEAGGIDYFGKPFDPDILKMKIAVYAAYRMQHELLDARERHVKESEELIRVGRKLSVLLEALPIGVLIADVEGRIVQATEEVARILGAVAPAQDDSYGEMLNWWDANGRMIKDPDGALTRAIQQGERSHRESIRIQGIDHTEKAILVSAYPLRGVDAHILGAVVLIQDLTEPKLFEEELERRIAGLLSIGAQLEATAPH